MSFMSWLNGDDDYDEGYSDGFTDGVDADLGASADQELDPDDPSNYDIE